MRTGTATTIFEARVDNLWVLVHEIESNEGLRTQSMNNPYVLREDFTINHAPNSFKFAPLAAVAKASTGCNSGDLIAK